MKPPYYRVTAECPNCGPVEVERKPHPKAGQRAESGGIIRPEPQSIVHTCGYHARVTSAVLVPKEAT